MRRSRPTATGLSFWCGFVRTRDVSGTQRGSCSVAQRDSKAVAHFAQGARWRTCEAPQGRGTDRSRRRTGASRLGERWDRRGRVSCGGGLSGRRDRRSQSCDPSSGGVRDRARLRRSDRLQAADRLDSATRRQAVRQRGCCNARRQARPGRADRRHLGFAGPSLRVLRVPVRLARASCFPQRVEGPGITDRSGAFSTLVTTTSVHETFAGMRAPSGPRARVDQCPDRATANAPTGQPRKLVRRVVRDEDLATAVVAAGLADRVRADHRAAVRAADELQAGKSLMDATATATCSADFSLWDCHLRIPSVLEALREPPRVAQHWNVGPDTLRTAALKSTAAWSQPAKQFPAAGEPGPVLQPGVTAANQRRQGPLRQPPRLPRACRRPCPCPGRRRGDRPRRRPAGRSAA